MKVILNSSVEHDGKVRAEGDTLELDDTQGAALVSAGAATELVEEVKKTSKKADA
jgi:hypothetical protein